MKKFSKNKINDLATIQGGEDGGTKLRRSIETHNFFDGEFGNECIKTDLKHKR